MTNTDRFSAARALSLTALYISENRRKLLLRTALLVGVMICIAIINIPYSYNWEEWPQREDIKLGDMTALYYFGGLILSCLGSSLMMEDIRSKEGRIRLLMRPTPITETFLSRWIIYVIAFPVIFLLSVALADAIRVGIAAITLPDYYAEFIFRPIFIDNENTRSVLGPPHYRTPFVASFIYIYFFIQSLFVLGSTIWTRSSFLKTFIVFGALTAIYMICAMMTGEYLMYGKIWPEHLWIKDHFKEIMFAMATAAILFNWTLGCIRLHELDVTTTKR
ncbi:hypothetical protein [Paramuribaculum intestinale]|uniref:hypothetical protein n=1 Tax=Paramuribaculum intestinale TaxID=2094151 RepID=UPI0025B01F07|nr:hypothetical protein [Paramuribaculum intestinale]